MTVHSFLSLNRETFSHPIPDQDEFRKLKEKVLNWVKPFNTFCFLDNHQYQLQPHSEECLLGVGIQEAISSELGHELRDLDNAFQTGRWWMGHLAYDLPLAALPPGLGDRDNTTGFPAFYFFEPQWLLRLSATGLTVQGPQPRQVLEEILQTRVVVENNSSETQVKSRLNREEYLERIRQLQAHIRRGDCYEINFCQEFYAENVELDPVEAYRRLAEISPNPFGALYRSGQRWLLCASPERYLRKDGSRILSQPIKGTSGRDLLNPEADQQAREHLYQSPKDRAENVMVVDLVRNDLSRICTNGSVKVDELYGVYSFPQVHQMISTISGELIPHTSFSDILEASFPMGSMTGAPKYRVMELIHQYEPMARGIFSGALGYVDPDFNFDFNVVIRSMLYHEGKKYLSFPTGSGITVYSDPDKEWEECQLKASAIRRVLGHGPSH